jgi:tRNA A37 methylthiotransferase MiaB
LWIGAESGSQKVLDLMDRRVDAVKTRELSNLLEVRNEAGTFIMLGYPGEER